MGLIARRKKLLKRGEYPPVTLERIKRKYGETTKALQEKLSLPETPKNLKDVYYLQRKLRGSIKFVYKFSDFYTAERVELIWDLLHEAKNYLKEHEVYREMAIWGCENFADHYITKEKAREAMLKLHESCSNRKFKDDLARIPNLPMPLVSSQS